MKKVNIHKIFFGGLCMGWLLSLGACSVFEKPNPFDQNDTPVASMSFNGSNMNITTMTAAETDEVTITVNLSSTEATSVRVDSRFRDGVGGVVRVKTLATLTPMNQVATFKMLARDMGTDAAPRADAGFNSIPLEFVAIGGGKTSTRRFTVTVTRPFALLSARNAGSALSALPSMNPTSASPGQTVRLGFTSTGAISGQRLTKVEIFRRLTFGGTEEVSPIFSKTYAGTAATVSDSLDYAIPANEALSNAYFFRYVATFANNQTVVLNAASATGTPRLTIVENPLQDLRTGLQMISSKSNAISGNNTAYNFDTVSFNGDGTDEAVKDMIMTGNGFRSGTGNGTMFVPVASTFNMNGATFQSAQTEYNNNVGSATTNVSLSQNNLFICKIRNRTGIDQFGVLRITGFTPNTNPALATFTFEFRSLRP